MPSLAGSHHSGHSDGGSMMSPRAVHLPAFSEFYNIITKNPQCVQFVQALGSMGISPKEIEALREESRQRAREKRNERMMPSLTGELIPMPQAPPTGQDEKPCPYKCAENRMRLQKRFEETRRERVMLMQRLTRLQEDSESAKRIALELEAECRGTQEEGQEVRVDIAMEQRRESELRDAIRAQMDERADINRRADKLEGELQRRRHELHDLEGKIRDMIWSSKKAPEGAGAAVPEDPLAPLPMEVVFTPSPSPSVLRARHRRTKSDCSRSGRSLFSDASRPLSRRYMFLVGGRTVDVMERWQYGLLRHSPSPHTRQQDKSHPPPTRQHDGAHSPQMGRNGWGQRNQHSPPSQALPSLSKHRQHGSRGASAPAGLRMHSRGGQSRCATPFLASPPPSAPALHLPRHHPALGSLKGSLEWSRPTTQNSRRSQTPHSPCSSRNGHGNGNGSGRPRSMLGVPLIFKIEEGDNMGQRSVAPGASSVSSLSTCATQSSATIRFAAS